MFQILGLSIRIYQYSPLRFKRSADMSINSAQKVVWSYTSTVCVCAVDTSCAHFPLSQLPPLIFSTHSYLQNSPLTKQVVLHYKCYFTDSLLYSNKTFYLQVLHYIIEILIARLCCTSYLTEKLKYSISLHKKESVLLLFLLNMCTTKIC